MVFDSAGKPPRFLNGHHTMVGQIDSDTVIAEEQQIMDLYAPHYRNTTLTNSYPYQLERRRFADWLVAILREAGAELADMSVLDVGCGTGEILQHLGDRGCVRLTGLDVSYGMIQEAARHLPKADLVNKPIDEYGFGNERFELITAAFTVHHLENPQAFFDLVDRALIPGGWFFLLEYNVASWSRRKLLGPTLLKPLVPLRIALKFKNKTALAALDDVPPLFNSAHQLLSYAKLVNAMRHPAHYSLQCVTHGLWLPRLKHALVGTSAIDRAITRALETVEHWILPAQAGHFQWVAGRRRVA